MVSRLLEGGRRFVLSPPFQCGVQASVSVLITGLFVVVRPLTFSLSCIAGILVTVAQIVLSSDNHIGTRLLAGANMLGGLVWGILLAGVMLTLARLAAPSRCTSLVGCGPHTAALCCLGVLGLAGLVASRAAVGHPHPPHLLVYGMLSVLGYGLTLIGGQLSPDVLTIWQKTVGGLLMASGLSYGVSAVVSTLVLPSLAVDEMRGDTAAAIRGIGHAASRLAGRALLQQPRQPRREGFAPTHAGKRPDAHPPEPGRLRPLGISALGEPFRQHTVHFGVTDVAPVQPQQHRERLPEGPQPSRPALKPSPDSAPAALPCDQEAGLSPTAFDHGTATSTTANCHSAAAVPHPVLDAAAPSAQPPARSSPGHPAPHHLHDPAHAPLHTLYGAHRPRPPSPVVSPFYTYSRPHSPRPPRKPLPGVGAQPGLDRSDGAASHASEADPTSQPGLAATDKDSGLGQDPQFSPGPATSPPPHATHQVPAPSGTANGVADSHFTHHHPTPASVASSQCSSDDDAWHPHFRRPTDPRVVPRDDEGDFELVLEDEDGFLRMLHEATAPQVPLSRRSIEATGLPRSARVPPRPTALPGGILPSPGAQDLHSLSSASRKRKPKGHAGKAAEEETAASGKAWAAGAPAAGAAVAAAAGDDGAQLPGAGPATAHGGGGLAGCTVAWAPVSALRPLLGRAKVCQAAARAEPPWLMRGPRDLVAWGRVLAACGMLLDRVSALECLAEDTRLGPTGQHGPGGTVGRSVLGDARLEDLLCTDILGPYRRVYGDVAAGCAAMAAAVEDSYAGKHSSAAKKAFAALGGWADSRQALHDHVRGGMAAYWARVRAGAAGRGIAASASTPALNSSREGAAGGPASGVLCGSPERDMCRLNMRPHPLEHSHQMPPHHSRSHSQPHRGPRSGKIPTLSLNQVRALTFLWTVTEGVLGAMDELEAAVREALLGGGQAVTGASAASATTANVSPDGAHGAAAAAAATDEEAPFPVAESAKEGSVSCGASLDSCDRAQPSHAPTGVGNVAAVKAPQQMRAGENGGCSVPGAAVVTIQLGSLPVSAPDAVATLQQAAPQKSKPSTACSHMKAKRLRLRSWLDARCNEWRWVLPLLELSLGLPMLQVTVALIRANLRALFADGPAGRSALLSSRPFQFGAKYWVTTSAVLCLILGLAARPELPLLRTYSLMYTFIAVGLSMTDRVESTLSRAAMRAFGTVLGGAIGLAVMVHPPLARSGAAVLAIVCAVAFVAGCQFGRRFLYAFSLTLVTVQSLALCQHGSACCDTPRGAAELFYVRVASVLLGCTLPVLANQVVLPWYTSDWALEQIAGACTGAAKVVRHLYSFYYQEHLRAHVSSRGLHATAELLRRYGHEEEAAQMEEEARAAEEARRGKGAEAAEAGQGKAPQGLDTMQQRGDDNGRLETAVPAASAEAESADAQALVSGPLVAVQTSLMKDSAVWTRGIYATPMVVSAVLRSCLQLSERLVALKLVVSDTPPPVEGRLSGWAFATVVLPLHQDMEAMLEAADRLAAATTPLLDAAAAKAAARARAERAAHGAGGGSALDAWRGSRLGPLGSRIGPLGSRLGASTLARVASLASAMSGVLPPPDDDLSELQAAIHELDMRRLQVRQSIHDARRAVHASVRQLDEQLLPYATHPDDTVRNNAMLFALSKVLDKATAVARTTLEARRRALAGGGDVRACEPLRACGPWYARRKGAR